MSLWFVVYHTGRRIRFPASKWRLAISVYNAYITAYQKGDEDAMPLLYPVIRR